MLAMPTRRIPVLVDSTPENSEGFVTSGFWNIKAKPTVRRLSLSFVKNLKNPERRKEIEREYGAIAEDEWRRLSALVNLIDRLKAGDWSPIIRSNTKKGLVYMRPSDVQMYHERPIDIPLQPDSDFGQGAKLNMSFSAPTSSPVEGVEPFVSTWSSRPEPAETTDQYAAYWVEEERSSIMTAAYVLAAALTDGTRSTQSVTWWFRKGQTLLPGYYCPDILSALYELEKWNTGTPGRWGICPKCENEFKRRNADQVYCTEKCQRAAANQRCRDKRKAVRAEAKPA
jgi:hypothetical protein